jgi:WD40 repeat protein
LSPDGKLAAVSTPRSGVRLRVLEPAAGTETPEAFDLEPIGEPVFGLGFSPDGLHFAAAGLRISRLPHCETVLVSWRRSESSGGAWERAFKVESKAASRRILLIPDAGRLILGGRHGSPLEIRALPTGELLSTSRAQPFVADLTVTPDGRHLVLSGEDGSVEFWTMPRGARGEKPQRVQAASCHSGRINCVEFLPGGQEFLTGAASGPVRLWRIFEGRRLEIVESIELRHPGGQVKGLAASADGRSVVAVGKADGGNGGWIQVWQAAED